MPDLRLPPGAVACATLRLGEGPWVDIALSGKWHHEYHGEFDLTADTFSRWVANVVAYGNRVKVDFDHNSLLMGATPEQNKAAGYIEPEPSSFRIVDRVYPDGPHVVLQADIKWTQESVDRIRAGEYWGISPVFVDDWTNPRSGESQGATLLNLALTSEPFLPGMLPVAAARFGPQKPTEETTMDEKAIRAALKLGDDESIEDKLKTLSDAADKNAALTAKVGELEAAVAELKPVVDEMETPEQTPDDVVKLMRAKPEAAEKDATIKALTRDLKDERTKREALSEDVKALQKAKADGEFTHAFGDLVKLGRANPAAREFARRQFDGGEEVWDAYVAQLPKGKDPRTLSRAVGVEPGAKPKEESKAEFMGKVEEFVAAGRRRPEALAMARKAHPDLYEASFTVVQ